MPGSAPNPKLEILITDISLPLGASVAEIFLSQHINVYGLGKQHLPPKLLSKKNFILLDLDLNQPLPSHLPRFDHIFHFLSPEASQSIQGITPSLKNFISTASQSISPVTIVAPIETSENLLQYLHDRVLQISILNLAIVGDLYGPGMDLSHSGNLARLIAQAVAESRVVLKNEGLDLVYPAFILDVAAYLVNVGMGIVDHPKSLKILTSDDPINTLSVAYTIQKVFNTTTHNDLGLYFGGDPLDSRESSFILPARKLPEATKLEQGLAETLKTFSHQMQQAQPIVGAPQQHVRIFQPKVEVESKFGKFKRFKKKPNLKIAGKVKGSKLKTAILATVAIFVMFLAKGVFDIVSGINNLKLAKNSLSAGSWQKAQQQSASAKNSLSKASGKINLLPKMDSLQNTFSALVAASGSLQSFSLGSQSLASTISYITSQKTETKPDIETAKSNFKEALTAASQAVAFAGAAQTSSPFSKQSLALLENTKALTAASQSAWEVSNLVGNITGGGTPKTYLLLLQNNTELRPGGGFIGNVGTIEFDAGKLKNVVIEDVYAIDGQLKEKLAPPPELKEKLGVEQFYLRDSNWNADSVQNAALARDFFKKETGKNVDGVITIDLNFMEEVIKATGPIKLNDYNETITAENLFDRGEFYSEVGFFPGSTQKKDFFGALSRGLISNLIANLSSPSTTSQFSYLKLLEAVNTGLVRKDLMLTFDDPILASYIQTHDFNNPLPPTTYNPTDDSQQTRDFLAISEANLGANKVNRQLERRVFYDVTVGRDADLVATLKIVYTNKSQADTWPAGKYLDFLRIYVPKGATLFEFKNGENTDIKQVKGDNQGPLTFMSTTVEVPIKSTKEVTFKYRIPKSIKLETAPAYALYVQKQPGTGADPFEFRFNLPNYLTATKFLGKDQNPPLQNLITQTTLETDRKFTVDIAKK